MATKGKIHPMNMAPAGDTPLDKLDFFFSHPDNTNKIGMFLSKEQELFLKVDRTDDDGALEAYALAKKYSELLDEMLSTFCEQNNLPLEDVAQLCMGELEKLEGAPSQYVCLPYIAAALDFEEFLKFVKETTYLMYGSDDDNGEESEDDDEEIEGEDDGSFQEGEGDDDDGDDDSA
eukprot:TRINITY_DN23590_c0_g1_i1.p1 TRINITY_DN23590_c0_g1~~TRINITY_DN23590_c0_g1_i1.p1  ORF type:complete len:176 (-),score=50.16 TRINITY_DN23590_c0_g1_i1:246-773(-)